MTNVKLFDFATREDSLSEEAWTGKGMRLFSMRKYNDALICINRAIQLNPSFVQAWLGKSLIFIDLGKYDDSLIYIDRTLQLDPLNVTAWMGKSLILKNLVASLKPMLPLLGQDAGV